MKPVKTNKYYPLKVVPYRPYLKKVVFFAGLITFIATIIGSFFLGRYYSVGDVRKDNADISQSYLQDDQKSKEIERLEQQVANLTLATEVDRKASDSVRKQVVDLKTRLSEMEQDNNFYRSLMRPSKGDQGIIIDPPLITFAGVKNKYQFNVVIKQIVAQHRNLNGYLLFDIVGLQEGQSKRLSLGDVAESIKDAKIKLRFKYFQTIKGNMIFPAGFIPDRIELKLVMEKPKKVVIEKKFGWLVKER